MIDKIDRIANVIKKLKVEELIELNKRLKDLGLPPLEHASNPVKPKPNPPTLTDAIGLDLSGEPLIKRRLQ